MTSIDARLDRAERRLQAPPHGGEVPVYTGQAADGQAQYLNTLTGAITTEPPENARIIATVLEDLEAL